MFRTARRCWLAHAILLAACLHGCAPLDSGGNGSSGAEQVLGFNPNAAPTPQQNLEVEPNDDFANATPAFAQGAISLKGSIAAGTATLDKDLWSLGAVQPGDRFSGTIRVDRAG